MIKTVTDCCALCQLSRVSNDTPIEQIEDAIKILTKQKVNNKEVGVMHTGNGQTAVFTIISPGEMILESNLKKLGFVKAHEFERRVGYPVMGDLKMYIRNL